MTLDLILGSPNRVRVLRALCSATAPLSGREAARRAQASHYALAALEELVAAGVVRRERLAAQHAFELNDAHPLAAALRELFGSEAAMVEPVADGVRARTTGEIRALLRALKRKLRAAFGKRLRGLYLYGSYARGDADPESDVDVVVVLDGVTRYAREVAAAGEALAETSLEFGATITPVFVGVKEWERGGSPFLDAVRAHATAA